MVFVIFKTGGPAVIEPIFMRDSGFPDHIFVRRQAPIIYIIICRERAGLPGLVGTTCSVPARCFTAVTFRCMMDDVRCMMFSDVRCLMDNGRCLLPSLLTSCIQLHTFYIFSSNFLHLWVNTFTISSQSVYRL